MSTAAGTALLFVSLALLSQLRQAVQLHADGTFRTVPKMFYQLFTLHFMAYGKVCFSNQIMILGNNIPNGIFSGFSIRIYLNDEKDAVFV